MTGSAAACPWTVSAICWEMLDGALCRYFREAVLPLDPALEAALLTEGPGRSLSPVHLRRARCPGSAAGLLLGGLCKESPPPPTAGICGAGLGR